MNTRIPKLNREDVDTLWHKAMHDSIRDGEDFTRYHFAAFVAAAEREACAKVCDALAEQDTVTNYYRVAALAIRARGDA